jgi:hypothetical protein
MKRILVTVAILMASVEGFAQTDTTKNSKEDTVQVGNFVIIKKPKKSVRITVGSNKGVDVTINSDSSKRKKSNVSTNWWILDLGFANLRDETDYAYAQAGPYVRMVGTAASPVNANSMKLRTGKSSNVNLWFFMQKLNVSKHVVNLKYGLGLEMYNFRYDNSLSYRKDNNGPYIFNDSIGFSKNKLYAGYITAPLMINFNATPYRKKGFNLSAGVSAGYLVGSRNKQVSDARGKVKYKGDFDLQPFRLAAVAELGLGPVRLYGSYSLNKLHDDGTRLSQYPYAIGIRFSNW